MNAYAQQLQRNVDAEGFNFAVTLDEVYTTAGDGYWSNAVKDVRVIEMGVFVSTLNEADEGDDEAAYCDGDFYVCYDEATWDMRKDGLIYTDSAFEANVKDFMRDTLLRMDVDDDVANELVGDITYSEQGMQDYGRVSFDAYALTEFLRNYYVKELA